MTEDSNPKEIKEYEVTFICSWGGSPKCLREWTVTKKRFKPPISGEEHGICPPCSEIFAKDAGLEKKPE